MHFFTLLLYNEKYMSLSKSTMDQAYNKILQVLKLNEREKKKSGSLKAAKLISQLKQI